MTVLPPSARAVTLVTTFSAALATPASASTVASPRIELRLMTAPFWSPVSLRLLPRARSLPHVFARVQLHHAFTDSRFPAAAEVLVHLKEHTVGRHARHQRVRLRDVIA